MKKKETKTSLIDTLMKQFKVLNECNICKAKIDRKKIAVFAKKGNSQMLHLTCDSCHNNLVFLVSISDVGIALVGMQSDLNFRDACRFYNKDVIDEEVLLSSYKNLYNISFSKYLK